MDKHIFNNAWVYDIEIFPNCFTLVARELDSKNYHKFVVHESQNDGEALMKWLDTRPLLIGYNSIDFDGQIIEFIWRNKEKINCDDLYGFVLTLPLNDLDKDRFDTPFSEWDLSFKALDLFKINHYDNKRTSLKWLEFTTRWAKLKDLPLAPHSTVSKSKIIDVLRYNTNDVDITYDFFYRCLPMIELRYDLKSKFREPRILNMSDASLGSYIFEHALTKKHGMKKSVLKKGTHRKNIKCSDCLLDYIYFETPEFNKVYETFKERTYEDIPQNGIKGEHYEQTVMFQDMVFVFGSGGLHACYKAGEYAADDEYDIISVDVKSYYPNLAIKNGFYPEHIGPVYCDEYALMYQERKKYPKGSALNFAYKIALNGTYGKSNSMFSIFFDPMYTLKITVNGQLLLAMLAEQLAKYGKLLMVNTDGIEIRVPKAKSAEVKEVCQMWEMVTNLELEYNSYKKLVIKDVNNYIAVDTKGNSKRKGMFEIYDDITEEGGKPHSYNKTPNATIIPLSIYKYYVEDTPIYDSITGENNIHEFCFGIKKQKKFEYWLITAQENGVIDIDKRDDRVLRYYISPGGANIYKYWKDDRKNNIQAVNKGQLVSLAMITLNTDIRRIKKLKGGVTEEVLQFDVDYDYYVRESQKVVDLINEGVRDKAYVKYMKQLEKDAVQGG